MYLIDGADEVLGRRRELDSVYCLLSALRSGQNSTAAGSVAGIEGAWCNIASFLLVPRPPHIDRLKIPTGDGDDDGALVASLSDWDACVEERVTMERSLSEEWASASEGASSDGEDASSPLNAELQFVRDQYNRSGLLLEQLNLPCSLKAMQRACAREEALDTVESVLRSKEGLADVHRHALERGRNLSAILAG